MDCLFQMSLRWLEIIGGLAVCAMMLVTTLDVGGRYFLNRPLFGAVEITELLMVMVIFMALPYLTSRSEHINVDLVPLLLPRHWAWLQLAVLDAVTCLAVCIMTPRIFKLAHRALDYGDMTEFLRIPLSIPLSLMAISFVMTGLAAFASLIRRVTGGFAATSRQDHLRR